MSESLCNYWKYLVISLLSVNQYKLEKTYLIAQELDNVGLFLPSNLVEWDTDKILAKLIEAECDRGEFMNDIFSSRIREIGKTIEHYGQNYCEEIFLTKDKQTIEDFLIPIHGIGKKVISNFFLLTEI